MHNFCIYNGINKCGKLELHTLANFEAYAIKINNVDDNFLLEVYTHTHTHVHGSYVRTRARKPLCSLFGSEFLIGNRILTNVTVSLLTFSKIN